MAELTHNQSCDGCKLSLEKKAITGGIVKLGDRWILNQYGGQEGFLGWLALQPYYHRMELTDLDDEETMHLGMYIKKVEIALYEYWAKSFQSDPIERMYVIYFFESCFDKPTPSLYHLHIHLIPRTKRLGDLLRQYTNDSSSILAWDIYKLSRHRDTFPYDYQIHPIHEHEEKIISLMTYLRQRL